MELIQSKRVALCDVGDVCDVCDGSVAAAAAAILQATPKFELLSPRKGGGDIKDCPMEMKKGEEWVACVACVENGRFKYRETETARLGK